MVFEISEQESIENYEIFREVRDNYGKLGFQFALDDTGAGYASLEAVLELAPEFIKVDRAFVRGIDQDSARQNMVRAFQAIARDMNSRIIGEGLDTLEELARSASWASRSARAGCSASPRRSAPKAARGSRQIQRNPDLDEMRASRREPSGGSGRRESWRRVRRSVVPKSSSAPLAPLPATRPACTRR